MKKKYWTIADDVAISSLQVQPRDLSVNLSHTDWIRALRNYLRMTQAELAQRSHMPQSHLAQIESGKTDPQVGTLKRIFEGLSCDLVIEPLPRKPLSEVLRGRARSVALKRLKHAMGTMALENQAPEKEVFKRLLEKRTDDVLNDPRERLWNKKDG
ncbi:MAG: helix-turn-helix domain-containing protein [Nitrospira sp.]|nr:helix-turn-helix domain-containing protein [Nitrospira sp.]